MRQGLTALLLLLLLLALATPPASGYLFGKNKVHYDSFEWLVYNSPHFELYYYPEEEVLASQAILLAEQAYERLAHRLDHRPKQRTPLVLYSSHAYFQQTNVTPELINEGTGGFTEIFRSRVVLPYQGSVTKFRHVVAHELVHVFVLDMLFGGSGPEHALRSMRGQFIMPPLWYMEGIAEYLSTGWDAEAQLYLEDAVGGEYIAPLDGYVYGFLNYKEGQAAIAYLAKRFGEGILGEMLRDMRGRGGLERALKKRTGLDFKELSEEFLRDTKERCWSKLAERPAPGEYAFQLLDHEEEGRGFHMSPRFSPRGDRLAFFADKAGEVNLYLASSLDGKVLRKLVTGHRSGKLESLHPFDTAFSFDPAGERLAFVALAGGRDELVIIETDEGREMLRHRPELDSMLSPAWSPDGRWIAVSGVSGGVTDLYLIDMESGALRRLTEDLADEQDPAWVDEQTLVYARHRELIPGRFPFPGEFSPAFLDMNEFGAHPEIFAAGDGYDLWSLDLRSGAAAPRAATAGDDRHPMPLAGGGLLFTSTAAGLKELWFAGPAGGAETHWRFYAPSGGVNTPSLSPEQDRLAFSSFNKGGYDIFVLEDLARLLADGESLAAAAAPETLVFTPFGDEPSVKDLGPAQAVVHEPDSLTGTGGPYETRFLLDAAGRNFVYDTLYGFYGTIDLNFKDVLGDQEIRVVGDVVGSLNANVLVSYTRRKSRLNWSVGGYTFRSYYQFASGTLGAYFPIDRFYLERRTGGFLASHYPFSLFSRLEGELNLMYAKREYYEGLDPWGRPLPAADPNDPTRIWDEQRVLAQPSLSLVHDDALFDYLGPVKGTRWALSAAYAQNLGGDVDVSRWMAYGDWRRYFLGPAGHSLALRLSGRINGGEDAVYYYLGGPYDLRGYEYLEFTGTRTVLGSVEWRFPFINYVWFGGPLPFSWGGIGGSVFADFGGAWDEDEVFSTFDAEASGIRLKDLKGDFGYGFRFSLGSILLLWDIAWPTDLKSVGSRQTYVSLGTQF